MHILPFILHTAKPFRPYVAIILANSCIYAGILIGLPYFIKQLANAAHTPDVPLLVYYGAVTIIAELCACIAWRLQDWAMLKFEPPFRNHISETLMERLMLQPHRFFQDNFAGSLAAKMGDIALSLPKIVSLLVSALMIRVMSLCFAFIMLAQVSIWLALGFLAWAILFVSCAALTLKKFDHLAIEAARTGSRITAIIADALTNMLPVRLFGMQQKEAETIAAAEKIYVAANRARRWFNLKLEFVQGTLYWALQAASTYFLVQLMLVERITPGDFALVLGINLAIGKGLWELNSKMRDFFDQWGMVEAGLETIYSPLEVQDAPGALPLQISKGEIVFENVHFNYHGAEPLFQQHSVVIPSGQKVGLVGYSGSGKSTFASLILRLYDITHGSIQIDGQPIIEVTQNSLREAIAFVPQEPSLFHRSIRENIGYGRISATEAEILAASRQAEAHTFIMQLPDGYETIVGERGAKLSGGQRQRIALARALLKKAPIMILDEATAQLDSATEYAIQLSLEEWFQSATTTLVIAHRLSTLRAMDRLLVFDKGRIVQDGSHAQLAQQEGLYRELWEAQTNGFLPEDKK